MWSRWRDGVRIAWTCGKTFSQHRIRKWFNWRRVGKKWSYFEERKLYVYEIIYEHRVCLIHSFLPLFIFIYLILSQWEALLSVQCSIPLCEVAPRRNTQQSEQFDLKIDIGMEYKKMLNKSSLPWFHYFKFLSITILVYKYVRRSPIRHCCATRRMHVINHNRIITEGRQWQLSKQSVMLCSVSQLEIP